MSRKGGTSAPWTLGKDRIVLVEGRDEETFFRALLRHLGRQDVQVQEYRGKTKLRTFLPTLVNQARYPDLQALLLVRDADHEPAGAAFGAAWASVCGSLTLAGIKPPAEHAVFSSGKPRVAIFIMPDGSSDGMLEDLCRGAVDKDPAKPLVDAYFRSLDETVEKLDSANDKVTADLIRQAPHRRAKAWSHAFLASRPEPDKRVGEAADEGYWPFNAPAFAPLVNLLQQL